MRGVANHCIERECVGSGPFMVIGQRHGRDVIMAHAKTEAEAWDEIWRMRAAGLECEDVMRVERMVAFSGDPEK